MKPSHVPFAFAAFNVVSAGVVWFILGADVACVALATMALLDARRLTLR